LQVPSWRQQTGYGDLAPGRPSLVHWPKSLASVALAQADSATDANQLLRPFITAFNRKPFGSVADILALPAAPLEEI